MNDLEAADLKTLALARPEVTDEVLDRLMAYQLALVEALESARALHPSDGLVRARREAEDATGIRAGELELLAAAVRAFCARRWTLHALEKKRGAMADPERAATLEKELARVGDLSDLDARFGAEAVERLLGKEADLLAVQERLRTLGLS